MACGKYSILNWRNRGLKQDWNPGGKTLPCSSVSGTWGTLWCDANSKRLGQPPLCDCAGWHPSWANSDGRLQLPSAGVPCSWHLQPPGISTASSFLQLHALPSQGLPAGTPTLPHTDCLDAQAILWSHGRKPPWPCNSCILHASKASTNAKVCHQQEQ
jgi:hypothetical protein